MDRRGIPGELQRAHCEPDRMAGKGRWAAAARGRGNRPGIAPRGARCRAHLDLVARPEVPRARRGALGRCLAWLALVASLIAAPPSWSAEKIVSSRVWPAQEYTRVTLESAHALKHQFFFVSDPARMVLDLEGVELDDELKALPGKVGASDPYIQSVRVGLNRPNVVRVVFDLRTEVKPSVFPLAPVGEYKHRLVLDIYPAHPADPLLALLQRPDPIGEIARTPTLDASTTAPPTPNDATAASLPVVKLEAAKTLALPS